MKPLLIELRRKYPGDWQPVDTWPPGCATYFTWPFVPNPEQVQIELARLGDVVIGRIEDGSIVHYNVCHVWDDGRGSVVGSDPSLEAAIGQVEATLPWADLVKLPKRSVDGEFDCLAALLSDHGATLAFTPMEDGPGYSAIVRFPDGGTAHADGSRGDLLGAVIESVECHVGTSVKEVE